MEWNVTTEAYNTYIPNISTDAIGVGCVDLDELLPLHRSMFYCVLTTVNVDDCQACCDITAGPLRQQCRNRCTRAFRGGRDNLSPDALPPCSIPVGPGPVTKAECCNIVKLNPACGAGRALGFLACCNGVLTVCSARQYLPGDVAGQIMTECVIEHESTHLEQSTCAGCPNNSVCRAVNVEGTSHRLVECNANLRHLECLRRNQYRCFGNALCELRLLQDMRIVCGNIRGYCGSYSPLCFGN